jgi:membrane associated rhomboid family serine protease
VFPLRDENPTLLTPFVTFALFGANLGIWIWLQGAGTSMAVLAESVCQYGAIPAEITGSATPGQSVDFGQGMPPCNIGGLTWATLITSMFLHGGWLHLISNLWFLWIFGNNVEDSMGHLRFLLFYLLCGLAAIFAQIMATPESLLPTVGASGAISGVMGAYLVFYPRVRVHTLFIFIIFFRIIPVQAWFILLLWFGIQLLSGYASPVGEGEGGVAFWAHVGGFVAGFLLARLFENRTLVQAKRSKVHLSPFEVEHRGWW